MESNTIHGTAWTLKDKALMAGKLDFKRWHIWRPYTINVNHPELEPMYKHFVYIVTGQRQFPPTEHQRREFERMVKSVLVITDKTPCEKQALLQWEIDHIKSSGMWKPYSWNPNWIRPKT